MLLNTPCQILPAKSSRSTLAWNWQYQSATYSVRLPLSLSELKHEVNYFTEQEKKFWCNIRRLPYFDFLLKFIYSTMQFLGLLNCHGKGSAMSFLLWSVHHARYLQSFNSWIGLRTFDYFIYKAWVMFKYYIDCA